MELETNEIYTYKIDNQDKIMSLSGNWLSFAIENEGAERNAPEFILGNSLWDYISGVETQHLYKIIIEEVRSKQKSVKFQFRCDAPGLRRYLQLSVLPLNDDVIEFRSQILQIEPRDTINLLDVNTTRSNEFLRMCSVCKKIAVTENGWEETDVAINTLRLFEKDLLPQLTHGLCYECFEDSMAEIKRMIAEK